MAEVSSCLPGVASPLLRAAPHFPQNFALGAFSKPHDAHDDLNAAPHSLQNFNPSGFSVLHFAQIMTEWLGAQIIEQRLGVLQVGGVEALGEPLVSLCQHVAGLFLPTLLLPQAG